MNPLDLTRLCTLYAMGDLIGSPQAVTGGLLHRMWHIETTKGHFAVKQLNPQMMQKSGIREAYRRSEQIAARMAAGRVPAATAFTSANGSGETVQDVGDQTFVVYEWINGTMLGGGAVSPAQAGLIGQRLGQIHSLRLTIPDLETPSDYEYSDWNELLRGAEKQDVVWSQALRSALPMLTEWTTPCEGVIQRLNRDLVISHRDLDQKNVLWLDPQSPILIDWESAGLTNPTAEVVGLALNWAGWPLTVPEETTFAAMLAGYRSTYHVAVSSELKADALLAAMGNALNWLDYNMRRSLDQGNASADERRLGERETLSTLAGLEMFWSNIERWTDWLAVYL